MLKVKCKLCGKPWLSCTCSHQKRADQALTRFMTKAQPKPFRRRGSPEKAVEAECLEWMRGQGWSVEIYEAKNNYNPAAGRWIGKSMRSGTVDCQGILPNGTFVAVEFKAPGKRAQFNVQTNAKQKQYLLEKIHFLAFGCVVDSAQLLKIIYTGYLEELKKGQEVAKDYLLSRLP